MAKRTKKTVRKVAHRSVTKKSSASFLSGIMDKKNRPLHGVTLGSVLVLLHSVWGILALVGGALIALSAVAYFADRKAR